MDSDYLDDTWITHFTDEDKLFQEYYKDDLYYINLTIIYVNRENEIEKIKSNSLLLSEKNKLTQEELLEQLKRHSIENSKRYSLLSILKYNILLSPDEILSYLKNTHDQSYFSQVKSIGDISFEKSISMFHDLNDLILVLYEKDIKRLSHTKRRHWTTNNKTRSHK